jgi:hypothetical protein
MTTIIWKIHKANFLALLYIISIIMTFIGLSYYISGTIPLCGQLIIVLFYRVPCCVHWKTVLFKHSPIILHYCLGKGSYGPLQSKGMCLLDLLFHSHLKPMASTSSVIAFPHVATVPGPTSLPGGLIV